MKTMNWTVAEIQGAEVDALISDGVLVGYVALDTERAQPYWRLYRGDGELLFRVWSRLEAIRMMDEIAPTLEFQL